MVHKKTKPKKNVKRSAHKKGWRPSIKPGQILFVSGVLCISGLLLFSMMATYSAVCNYKGFAAKRVVVFGSNRLSDREVLKQARVFKGQNIFKINLSVARQRLLAHPWIHSAEVTREIPDAILIKIRENEPMAIVETSKRYLMNTDGDIFKHFSGEGDELPVITGLSPEDINVAGRQTMKNETNPHKAVMNIIQLAKGPETGLPLSQIKQILVDREIGLTLLTSGNIRTVKLGFENYEEKFRRMGEVSRFLKDKAKLEEINILDLQNLERIVVKPAVAHETV